MIEVELNGSLNADPAGTLYSERPVKARGSSTYIQGLDQCGSEHKAGIATTLSFTSPEAIQTSGSPIINGTPPIQYGTKDLPLREMVEYLKNKANFKYSYSGDQTLTGYSDTWGIPTYTNTTTPLQYNGPMDIVYFKMEGNTTLKLAGGSHGAGILLVDGNLELNGGFQWYGLIIVTGALDYTGGGEKNVTGAVMTGEATTINIDVGGNTGIINCSAVTKKLKDAVGPFRIIRWREVF